MSKLLLVAAVASQMACWSALAADKSTTALSKKDVSFIHDAANGGMAEVRMGEIGLQRGQSADVKALAQKLITDHKKANDSLKELATSKGMSIPMQLDDKEQKRLDKLTTESNFDKAFKDAAIKDHKKDIKEFESALKRNDIDTELKSWIAKTLPDLQEHLRMAEQLGVSRTTSR